MTDPIRVATRRSPLALAQARLICDRLLTQSGRSTELVEIVSEGDVNPAPLTTIGGTGVFVTAVREALLDGRADIAVHSMKDLPTAPAAGLTVAAVPSRADARDALCGSTLTGLPEGARVGTGSPRRRAQLLLARPDLQLVGIRGNVGTRLARVEEDLAAVVLAAAGLERLGLGSRVTETLEPDLMLPAPGQGVLAIETRGDAAGSVLGALSPLEDLATRAEATAERALLAALEAGCSAPVGALAQVSDSGSGAPQIHLRGGVFTDAQAVHMSVTGSVSDAQELGRELADHLLAAGAAGLLSESKL